MFCFVIYFMKKIVISVYDSFFRKIISIVFYCYDQPITKPCSYRLVHGDTMCIINITLLVDMHNSTLANEYSVILIMYIGSPATYMNMALWLVDHNHKRQ
jgi:hypothetical protein